MPFYVQQGSVDENGGFMMHDTPLLPLIRAVELVSNEDKFAASLGHRRERVDWRAVDFITNRGNLRKLLRWIDGSSGGRVLRIDAQLAGDGTVLLNKWERRTPKFVQPGSYGTNLEKATTKPAAGCEGTTTHHRVVKYVSVACPWHVMHQNIFSWIEPYSQRLFDGMRCNRGSQSVQFPQSRRSKHPLRWQRGVAIFSD